MSSYLGNINSPQDLKKLPVEKLPILAEEIRRRIIDVVSKTGGHLSSNLGVVELTIALHYVFNMPGDKILFDVGHQCYTHKILTGRESEFDTLRQLGGISGFPSTGESIYDLFTWGHSSTSISTGLGLVCARDLKEESWKVICVVGDASLANGMAFEALNHAGHLRKDLIIVLNDNEHSISRTVGALSRYLNKIITNPLYNKLRRKLQVLVKSIPVFGFKAFKAARRLEESLKALLVPGMLFEELGFRYFGPVNGHDINGLISMFENVSRLKEPIIVHVMTKKGKGYKYAEKNPTPFHSAKPFDINTGLSSRDEREKTFTQIFSEKITELARANDRILAITAAMPDGTGLSRFAQEFPRRFFDVGIAEEHAVAFSAGLAHQGFKPVVAIYSTFLQRGYDQLIHDISLQKLPVVFCLDRAGIVGEDGPTHHGVFDIAYLRHIPNLVIMAPRDGLEFEKMLEFAITIDRPVAIRYPKAHAVSCISASSFHKIEFGKSELLRHGKDIVILTLGSMVSCGVKIADMLSSKRIEATLINARFVKPLDKELLRDAFLQTKKVITLEEGVVTGGFGSAILEFIQQENIKDIKTKIFGLPDNFVGHGRREEILKEYHLTPEEVSLIIIKEFFGK